MLTEIDAYQLMHNGTLALTRAEAQGIRVDLDYVQSEYDRITLDIERYEHRLMKTKFYKHWEHSSKSKVNINSNSQLANFLYGVKKLTPTRLTESGKGSTDEEALKQMNIPELNLILKIRKLKKLRDTYLVGFTREQVGGVLHPFFNLHLVKTFRSSADRPNFQNIPKRDKEAMRIVRQALYPRPGHQFLEVDYGSLEVRIAACYHKDPVMLKYINDPTSDMHSDMTRQIFLLDDFNKEKHNVLRQAIKNGFVFPQFYGDYYKNCASRIAGEWCKLPYGRWKSTDGIEVDGSNIGAHFISKGIKSYQSFENHIKEIEYDFWRKRFAVYDLWREDWYQNYLQKGYIDMFTGFRCHGPMTRNDCINYPVQGAAFHCLLWSFIEIDKIMQEEKWRTRLIGQIHDSIILDVHPKELDYVKEVVQYVTCEALAKAWDWIIVPLVVEMSEYGVDSSWASVD